MLRALSKDFAMKDLCAVKSGSSICVFVSFVILNLFKFSLFFFFCLQYLHFPFLLSASFFVLFCLILYLFHVLYVWNVNILRIHYYDKHSKCSFIFSTHTVFFFFKINIPFSFLFFFFQGQKWIILLTQVLTFLLKFLGILFICNFDKICFQLNSKFLAKYY